jgi:hypothetical protein
MRKITHEGELNLNGLVLPCFVLEDGTRVLSGRGLQEALYIVDVVEGKQTSGARLTRFFNNKTFNPFIFKDKVPGHYEPIICYKGKTKIHGYEATILADICDAVLEAKNNSEPFTDRMLLIAERAEVLIRAFAKVGIIALVDEATGYQYDREKNELQKILQAYISPELLPWQKQFPDSFYTEIFRLNGWDFTVNGINKKPKIIGKWTNLLIYSQLPNGVLDELKQKTPKTEAGEYKAKFHQSLTVEIGHPNLQAQLTSVITLFRISNNMKQFFTHFKNLVQSNNGQLEIGFNFDEKGHAIILE